MMQNEEHGEDMATLAQQQAWEGALLEHRSTKVGCRQAYVPEKWALSSLGAAGSLVSPLGSQALKAERRN